MSVQAKAADTKIRAQEAELGKLNKELQLDLLQAGVDAAGIIDPTPVTDLVGAGISLYRGDFIGAGLSLISMIPLAGDAIGKTAKGIRLVKKMNDLRKRIAAASHAINAIQKRARQYASAYARAKKLAKSMGKEVDDALIEKCLKEADDLAFSTKLPSTGFKGVRGDSAWIPDASSSYGKKVLEWQKKNGIEPGSPIEFRGGFPDFSPFAKARVKINMTGVDSDDFKAANDAMKKLDPGWKGQPADMTWHHSEDGVTMLLVPSELNSIPHTGGAALAEVPGF